MLHHTLTGPHTHPHQLAELLSTMADQEAKSSNDAVIQILKNAVPYDPRFPNMNQTKNCQVNYIDYFRCLKKKDETYCAWYKNAYQNLCPPDWYEKWDEQRQKGTFPFPELCERTYDEWLAMNK